MVYYFYGRGCDIRRVDLNNDNPLELARRFGINEVVNLFKSYDVNSISELNAMNFLSFDDKQKKIILSPIAIRLISSIPADKKIYSLCIGGLSRAGKSFFLNALIIYLSIKGYLKSKVTDDKRFANIFESSSNDRDNGVTEGSNFIVLYLREGSEKWANGVILLFDFEGLGNDEGSHLSLYLSIATQICTTFIFMSTDSWNDANKSLLARMVAASMVKRDIGRGSPVWPALRVILNKRETDIDPRMIEEIYSKNNNIYDQSKENINKEFNTAFPNRSISRIPTKSKGFDNASIFDIVTNELYINYISPYFEELLPSLLSSPISINNIPFTGFAFAKYLNDLIDHSNDCIITGHLFASPVKDFSDIVERFCQYHVQDCLKTFHYAENRPKGSMCDGRNIDRLLILHNELVDMTIDRYLELTVGFSNWNIRDDIKSQLLSKLLENWNEIESEHQKKFQILENTRFNFESQRDVVLATIELSHNEFPSESSNLHSLAANVSINDDPIAGIGTIKEIISNGKFEKVIPPIIEDRDFYREEEVPAVMGTRVIPAVYTDVDVPVLGKRDVKAIRHIPAETKTVRVCRGHSHIEKIYTQNNAQNYYNSMNSSLSQEKRNGTIRDFKIDKKLTGNWFEDCVISWSKFCADDRCGSETDTRTDVVTPARSVEYVSGSESYVQSFKKEKRLVTPERTESYVVSAKSMRVIHETKPVEIAPSRMITHDLSPLCEAVDKWSVIAKEYWK
eukprot:gene24192-31449_t